MSPILTALLLAAQVATASSADVLPDGESTPTVDIPIAASTTATDVATEPPEDDEADAAPADEAVEAARDELAEEQPEVTPEDEDEETDKAAEQIEVADEEVAVQADDYFTFSDFVDTRVTFALSNVNVFAGPGERINPTSGYRIGVDRNFNLFLENVNTRFSGFESLSHIVLHKKSAAFFKYWETEAALAALVLANTNTGEFAFFDSGTYLRIIRKFGDGPEHRVGSVDLTAWPVSSDRFRLGYTFLISWGGTAIFPGKLQSRITEGAVPGMRLRYRAPGGKGYAFIGFKSALLLNREPGEMAGEQVPNYGVLAGGGIDIGESFIAEVNGGAFQKGTQERVSVEGERIGAYGASARLTFYNGRKPNVSSDFRLYRNDPGDPVNYDVYKGYRSGTSWSVAAEGSYLVQNLEDPDLEGSEKLVGAISAGLVGRAQFDELSVRVDAFFQSANFILFNVPGFVPFQATPSASTTSPEFFAAATAAYHFPDLHLQPSLSVGVKVPATYQGEVLTEQGQMVGGATAGEIRTQIIADATTRIILPPNTSSTPVIGILLRVPMAISKTMSVSGEVRFEIDDNQPRIAGDHERGEVNYIFDSPERLGLALVLQSRW